MLLRSQLLGRFMSGGFCGSLGELGPECALGRSGLRVPRFGFGGGTLGDPNEVISEAQAQATLARAYDRGVRYFDTAPWYGLTKSEHRIGHFLRQKERNHFILNTKVGRVFSRPDDPSTFSQDRWKGGLPFQLRFDYTADGFRRSYEDSLARLGINTVDSLVVHDIDYKFHHTDEGVESRLEELDRGGGFEWLREQRAAGEIRAIGIGVNQDRMFARFVERFGEEIDFFLVAMPYTLLDQPALDEGLKLCEEKGISVIVGAVYASGILATGSRMGALYGYQPADERVVGKVAAIEEVCARHKVPLGAAALQFPLAHPVVNMVIPGANSPEIVSKNLEWIRMKIPAAFWSELKAGGLLRKDAPTP